MITFKGEVRPYRKRIKHVAAASGDIDLKDDIVEAGRARIINHAAVINETTQYSELQLGVFSGPHFYSYEQNILPNADDIIWTSDEYQITDIEVFGARLKSVTSGDIIIMYIAGYEGDLGLSEIEVVTETAMPRAEEEKRLKIKPHILYFVPLVGLHAAIQTARSLWAAQYNDPDAALVMPDEMRNIFSGWFKTPTDKVMSAIKNISDTWSDPGDPSFLKSFSWPPLLEIMIRALYGLKGS